jgi:hypothetical protein
MLGHLHVKILGFARAAVAIQMQYNASSLPLTIYPQCSTLYTQNQSQATRYAEKLWISENVPIKQQNINIL